MDKYKNLSIDDLIKLLGILADQEDRLGGEIEKVWQSQEAIKATLKQRGLVVN